MALKCAPFWVCSQKPHFHLGTLDLGSSRGIIVLDLRPSKWECCSLGASAQRAINPVEDEKPNTPWAKTSRTGKIGQAQGTVPRTFHKDVNFLSKPLTQTDLSPLPDDGSKVRVAYQGIPGAYSEDAALKAYPNCETVPCDQFEEIFNAVELWLVDKAVLPIENSVGGSIHRNYDLLLQRSLHIVREVRLVVNHSLLALPGVRKEEVKRAFSHPQALDQCEMTLTKLGITRVNADESAPAAKIVASSGIRDIGAIASSRAAALYGLNILQEKIQDEDIDVARFLVLAREPIIPGTEGLYKTSIVFSLEEGPGMLFKALAVFYLRAINLSKIESRPQRRCPLGVVDDSNNGTITYFDSLFYIDFEASMAEPHAQNAMALLQEYAGFLRVLGSYPMDKTLDTPSMKYSLSYSYFGLSNLQNRDSSTTGYEHTILSLFQLKMESFLKYIESFLNMVFRSLLFSLDTTFFILLIGVLCHVVIFERWRIPYKMTGAFPHFHGTIGSFS